MERYSYKLITWLQKSAERRNRADLIEVFKIARGLSVISLDEMFHLISTNSGSFIEDDQVSMQQRCEEVLFSFPVISKWNMLDDTTVTANTLNSFKTKLEMEGKICSWTEVR